MEMKQLRIYLDTSVINFLLADDAPEQRDLTVEFFDRVVRNSQTVFVSQLVAREIERTKDSSRRGQLQQVLQEYGLPMLPAEPQKEIESLASEYQRLGAIPRGHWEDATHVAICTVHEVDVLVSWNFKHLANVQRERRIAAVNASLGYVYPLRITSPLELMNDE
jgi:predicted nucleic acid-binding protein